jgi:hypothetical protein
MMSSRVRKLAKRFFMRLPYSGTAQLLSALPLIRSELEQHPTAVRIESRFALYAWLAERLNRKAVRYLEFGVFEGESIREWARIVPSADSTFVGFDSFEGLPEDWGNAFFTTKKGTFTTGGRIPDIADPRVSFVKGWFNETLPQYVRELRTDDRQLIINLDADLYTSTTFVLHQLNSIMTSGTILIFDEFGSPLHEYRALKDWAALFDRRYRIDCYVHATLDQVALTLL